MQVHLLPLPADVPPAGGPRRRWWGVALLLGLALALRVAAIFTLDSFREPFTYEHGEIAANVVAGRGFSVRFLGSKGLTSQQAPAFPYLLAGCYQVWGVETPQALLALQLMQAVAGTLTVLVTMWLAWSLLPRQPAVGWAAGLLAALAPPHIYMVTHVQVVAWAALGLTLLLAIACSPRCATRWWGMVAAGLVAGLLLLFEPILAVGTPLAAVAVLIRNRARLSWPRALLRPAVMAAVAWLVVTPWLVRNYQVHGQFVFIKTTFGYAFWQGNNPASWGTDKVPKQQVTLLAAAHDGTWAGIDRALWDARHETIYIDDLLLKPKKYRRFKGLSEIERCEQLGAEARQFIAENPQAYLALCGQRLRYFWLGDETNPKTWHPLFRVSNMAWLALTAIGLFLLRREWRMWWPLAAVFVAVMLFHTLTITSARFRIPVEPLTLVWAGAPLAAVWTRLRDPQAICWGAGCCPTSTNHSHNRGQLPARSIAAR